MERRDEELPLTATKLKEIHPVFLKDVSVQNIEHHLQKDLHLPTFCVTKKPLLTLFEEVVVFVRKCVSWSLKLARECGLIVHILLYPRIIRCHFSVNQHNTAYMGSTVKYPTFVMLWCFMVALWINWTKICNSFPKMWQLQTVYLCSPLLFLPMDISHSWMHSGN